MTTGKPSARMFPQPGEVYAWFYHIKPIPTWVCVVVGEDPELSGYVMILTWVGREPHKGKIIPEPLGHFLMENAGWTRVTT